MNVVAPGKQYSKLRKLLLAKCKSYLFPKKFTLTREQWQAGKSRLLAELRARTDDAFGGTTVSPWEKWEQYLEKHYFSCEHRWAMTHMADWRFVALDNNLAESLNRALKNLECNWRKQSARLDMALHKVRRYMQT